MRDFFIGGTGVVLGGLVGIGGTLALELLVAGAVGATLIVMTASPEPPPPEGVVVAPAKARKVAEPGELQLMTMAAVQPMVDGVPMGFDPQQGYLAELPEGTHRVQILDMLGRPVGTSDVTVKAGQRTQLRWASKQLSDLGRVPMLGIAVAPIAPVAPVPDAEIARAEREIGRAMAEVDAAIAEVEGRRNAVEAVATGLMKLPKLGRRLGRGR